MNGGCRIIFEGGVGFEVPPAARYIAPDPFKEADRCGASARNLLVSSLMRGEVMILVIGELVKGIHPPNGGHS